MRVTFDTDRIRELKDAKHPLITMMEMEGVICFRAPAAPGSVTYTPVLIKKKSGRPPETASGIRQSIEERREANRQAQARSRARKAEAKKAAAASVAAAPAAAPPPLPTRQTMMELMKKVRKDV